MTNHKLYKYKGCNPDKEESITLTRRELKNVDMYICGFIALSGLRTGSEAGLQANDEAMAILNKIRPKWSKRSLVKQENTEWTKETLKTFSDTSSSLALPSDLPERTQKTIDEQGYPRN